MHVVQIEDDRSLREILKVALQAVEPNITLRQFIAGDDAVAYIGQYAQTIDLFVIDLHLPGKVTGVQLAQTIRDLQCPGFIVLTSAYAPPEDDVLASLRSEYYPKPWHILEVTQKLLKYRLSNARNLPLF
jgi:DNA-binding response OmpR family regulator